jgi:predicted ATP-grasp superfamily ATP-dependent carboligase
LVVPDPLENAAAFVAAIGRALETTGCAVLIPGSDASLLALSAARDALPPSAAHGLPRHEVVERCLDKLSLASAASRHGLGSPQTAVCDSADEAATAAREIGLPVLVKPTCSVVERAGDRQRFASVRADDALSVTAAAGLLGPRVLIQRVEPGPVLSFAGVLAGGRLLAEALSRYDRTWCPEAGNVSFSHTIAVPGDLRALVIGLLDELGWEGLFELELIERKQGVWAAIDLNPRPYGSLALAIGAGANLPAVWCAHLLGRDPEPTTAMLGVRYRWEDADLRHALWHARRRNARAAAAVLRLHRGVVHAYFAPDDPGPILARAVYLTSSTWRRTTTWRPVHQSATAPGLRRA